ncbi:hypothetical protein BVRB_5g117720 [Beta vulgaris subsp. vulgaris]|nr:hypothetical protein BVRB_5g117720 [Beta vulgaris subsp. vulgaris]
MLHVSLYFLSMSSNVRFKTLHTKQTTHFISCLCF